MRKLAAALSALVLVAVAAPADAQPFPDVIPLPNGWQAEGVATGPGTAVYAGSLADGAIWKGDLRTGEGAVLVPGRPGGAVAGLASDARSGLLFAAGALTGQALVYDASTGDQVAALQLLPPFSGFVNDVIVTREAAWFTDSFSARLFRVDLGPGGSPTGTVRELALTGDWVQVPGSFVFNANGIEASPDGRTLLVVNSTVGAVYAIDAATGVATLVQTDAALTAGDGILLQGRTLYVVRNQLNEVAVLRLSPDLSSATLVDTLTDPDFAVPTTIAGFGSSLYAVNARFGTPPTPTTPYEIVRVDGR